MSDVTGRYTGPIRKNDQDKRIRRDAKRLAEKTGKLADSFQQNKVQFSDSTYPAPYFSRDPSEKEIELKYLLAKKTKERVGKDVDVSISPDDREAKLWIKRDEELYYLQFEAFIEKAFLGANSGLKEKEWVRENVPEYYEKRKAIFEQHLELQRKLAMIKLYGIQTRDDVELLFNIVRQQIRVPTRPVFDTQLSPEERQENTRGLFNANRWLNGTNETPSGLYTATLPKGLLEVFSSAGFDPKWVKDQWKSATGLDFNQDISGGSSKGSVFMDEFNKKVNMVPPYTFNPSRSMI